MTIRRRNRINAQFSARLIEMLEAPAYRALSRSAHLVIARIEVELAHHGGNDNGRLPVTTEDFVVYGMDRGSVAPAIREAEALGFIRVTQRGHGGNAEHRSPNYFLLTFAHNRNSRAEPPTHDWRRIKTLEDAEQIARTARANKNPRAVALGKRSRKRQKENRNQLGKPQPNPVGKTPTENHETPVGKTPTTVQVKNPHYFLKSGVGATPDAPRPAMTALAGHRPPTGPCGHGCTPAPIDVLNLKRNHSPTPTAVDDDPPPNPHSNRADLWEAWFKRHPEELGKLQ